MMASTCREGRLCSIASCLAASLLAVPLLAASLLAGCTSGAERAAAEPDALTEALLAQGLQALRQQAFGAALALADSAARRAPEEPDVYFLRGRILSEMARLEDAEAAYRRAAALRPDYPGLWHNLANNALRRQQFDEAIALYYRELQQHPTPRSWRGIGRAYVELGRQDSARHAFERALTLDSSYVPAYLNLALLLESQGQYEEALRTARRGLAADSLNLELRYTTGALLAKTGRSEAALPYLRSVLVQRPWHHAAHFNLGQALLRLGRQDEARRHMERADTLRAAEAKVTYLEHAAYGMPQDPAVHAALGHALREVGRYGEALRAFRTALYLDPQDLALQHAIATLHMLRGEGPAAVAGLRAVLQQDATQLEAWLNLGLVYAAAGRKDAAREAWQQALRLDPGHPAARSYLARLEGRP